MEGLHPNYKIFPLGDSGATIDLGNSISLKLNKKVRSMQEWFANHPLEGIKDLIAGYSSLSILYDPVLIKKKYNLSTTAFEFIRSKLLEAWNGSSDSMPGLNG